MGKAVSKCTSGEETRTNKAIHVTIHAHKLPFCFIKTSSQLRLRALSQRQPHGAWARSIVGSSLGQSRIRHRLTNGIPLGPWMDG